MATRALIAEPDAAGRYGWRGRYHHWDGHVESLGFALWRMQATVFASDTDRLRRVLIHDHPAGWSTIVAADWSQEPGFNEHAAQDPATANRPQCYCHGDRHEPEMPLADTFDAHGAEYVYVIRDEGLDIYAYRKHLGLVPWHVLDAADRAVDDLTDADLAHGPFAAVLAVDPRDLPTLAPDQEAGLAGSVGKADLILGGGAVQSEV